MSRLHGSWLNFQIDVAMSETTLNVVAIIPAYNEAARVGSVVRISNSADIFTKVVVVDDGSTDQTAAVARDAGAEVISHPRNTGKPGAMLTGIKNTSEPVICFLDADLVNITPEMIQELVLPIAEGRHAAALAVFSGGRLATTLAQRISPMISGQRCLTRQALQGFDAWDSGFGIETAINAFLRKQGVNQLIVKWDGATHIMKEEKLGFYRGFLARLKMYWQIFITWLRTKG